MMVKGGAENMFSNSSIRKANFGPTDLFQRMKDFSQNYKFSEGPSINDAFMTPLPPLVSSGY